MSDYLIKLDRLSRRDRALILRAIQLTGSKTKLAKEIHMHRTEVGKMIQRGWIHAHMRHLLRKVCRDDR